MCIYRIHGFLGQEQAINYDKGCIKIIYKLNSRNYIKMSENVAADERRQKAEIPFRESQLDAADRAEDEARRLNLRFCRCWLMLIRRLINYQGETCWETKKSGWQWHSIGLQLWRWQRVADIHSPRNYLWFIFNIIWKAILWNYFLKVLHFYI